MPPAPAVRPRRGTPAETRARLVAAAARVFNRDGYHGTDSNRLARAAGYAPGTFYRHFPDKRAAFLAVYEAWVTAEWTEVERAVRAASTPAAQAERIVDRVLASHRRWRGVRASLRALVASDAGVRAFYRAQRRRQLALVAAMRRRARGGERRPEADAVLLFTLERVCDAIADGELRELGLALQPTVALLRALVRRALVAAPARASVRP
jgi:AcrR family transcriptional regulator